MIEGVCKPALSADAGECTSPPGLGLWVHRLHDACAFTNPTAVDFGMVHIDFEHRRYPGDRVGLSEMHSHSKVGRWDGHE
jgi:hypothetical protein